MSLIIKLPGRRALSDFRIAKLLVQLRRELRDIRAIRTQYRHFAKLKRVLSPAEGKTLASLLTYGPAAQEEHSGEGAVLVVPRLGTISPWASKATDIAHRCGL